jgi:hypothetical protein
MVDSFQSPDRSESASGVFTTEFGQTSLERAASGDLKEFKTALRYEDLGPDNLGCTIFNSSGAVEAISLASLTALQMLNLSECEQLYDLRPLARLTSIQTLDLSECGRLIDLGPLAGLTSLQRLNLQAAHRP